MVCLFGVFTINYDVVIDGYMFKGVWSVVSSMCLFVVRITQFLIYFIIQNRCQLCIFIVNKIFLPL